MSVVKARAAKSVPVKGKSKVVPDKTKPSPEKSGKGKKGKQAATDPEVEDDPEDGGAGDSSAGTFLYEGDPGFEEAFQAARLRRQQAQQAQAAPEDRSAPRPPPLAAPASGSLPRPRPINPITGLPFLGPRRRPEALSGYGDRQTRRRSPAVGSSTRTAPSTTVRDNTMRTVATRTGFPVTPTMNFRPSVYAPRPDGMHYHYTDNSGVPAFARHFEPTNSHIGFTPDQRRARAHQLPAPPPQPRVNPYSVPPPHQSSANPYLVSPPFPSLPFPIQINPINIHTTTQQTTPPIRYRYNY